MVGRGGEGERVVYGDGEDVVLPPALTRFLEGSLLQHLHLHTTSVFITCVPDTDSLGSVLVQCMILYYYLHI